MSNPNNPNDPNNPNQTPPANGDAQPAPTNPQQVNPQQVNPQQANESAAGVQEADILDETAAKSEVPPGFITRLVRWIGRLLLPVWRHVAPPLKAGLRLGLTLAQKIWAGPVGRLIQQIYARITATALGQKCEEWVLAKAAALKARYLKWREIYVKLTSPPPDPLMAAMMMQNEPIDIDQDDIKLTGNKVFVYITSFFAVFVLWAMFAKLDESVRADGAIVPPSSVQLVQNRLPGSLVSIETKLGEHVEKGQVLFKLEDEDVIANFDDNEITRLASLAMKARLTAEADGEAQVQFPDWMQKGAPDVVAREQDVFDRRQKALQTKLASLTRRIKNFEEKIEILKPLVEAGHEARLTLVDVQGQYHAALDEYDAVVANFRAEAAGQLAEVNKQADQAGAREDAFRAKVAHAEVKAPASGTVTAVHVKTVGAVVQAGTVLAEIVPDEKAILVMARLPAEDVADVYPGQIAQVSLSAYDVSRHGTLEGRVSKIAQNTTQEENMPPFYQTIIEIDSPRFSKSDEELIIVPGSPVMVDIIGNKRTIMSYILTPLERAAGRAFREK